MKIIVSMAEVEGEELLPPGKRTHYYTEVANNGEPISTSEMYPSRGNAVRAANKKSKAYAEFVPVYMERTSRNG